MGALRSTGSRGPFNARVYMPASRELRLVEAGIGHAQWLADLLLEVILEGCAIDGFTSRLA